MGHGDVGFVGEALSSDVGTDDGLGHFVFVDSVEVFGDVLVGVGSFLLGDGLGFGNLGSC